MSKLNPIIRRRMMTKIENFKSKVRCPNCWVTKKFYVHCFNCGEDNHIRKDCPFEINAKDKKNEGRLHVGDRM